MSRPCRCGRASAGPYTNTQCLNCWKWLNSEWWRRYWSNGVTPQDSGRFSLDCALRGPTTGEVVPCRVCGGTKDEPVYSCSIHGRCVLKNVGHRRDAPKWCRTCEDKATILQAGGSPLTMKWMYGVTTVPSRRDDYLPRTLASLRAGGFDRPHLFVDGSDDSRSWREEFGLDVTCRFPKIRTGGNWALSLGELYSLDPHADRYAVFQDDFVTCLNLRHYLEATSYPEHGYLNLYSFPRNERLSQGKIGFYPSNQRGLGAVALVFSNEAVVRLLTSDHLVRRFQARDARHKGWRSIDGGIVESFRKMGWKEYVHNPSLVQHIGDVSSMNGRPHLKSRTFMGETFDLLTLLPKGPSNAIPAQTSI